MDMIYEQLQGFCQARIMEFDKIPLERKETLEKITAYIASKLKARKPVQLVYICTHNSRRSHFGQIWARVAACYYHIKDVNAFSGGTEATAFHSNAIYALKRIGFIVMPAQEKKNPVYKIRFDDTEKPIECFSKVYDDVTNPLSEFAAIMTCGEAEENCPFIPGVEFRIATTYEDPKIADNTVLQDITYDKRCRQIAREVLYVFSKLTPNE
jgi:protein-tyrosine phosphatase/arsenate reductase